jgi:hypothetical protein
MPFTRPDYLRRLGSTHAPAPRPAIFPGRVPDASFLPIFIFPMPTRLLIAAPLLLISRERSGLFSPLLGIPLGRRAPSFNELFFSQVPADLSGLLRTGFRPYPSAIGSALNSSPGIATACVPRAQKQYNDPRA